MKLRSHTPGSSSSKGKAKRKYAESSDEDVCGSMCSDSDYDALNDEGGEFLNAPEDHTGEEALDLNLALDTASETSDDDLLYNVSKRRRSNSRKNGEGPSHSVQVMQDRGSEGVINGEIEAEVCSDPVGFDSSIVTEEKRGKRKKSKKRGDKPVLMWEVLEQENERWVAENLEIDMDLINQNDMVTEIVEPSDDLIIPLLRYQKEWLAWSLKQEESVARGGILADEMGMGKTLQAIALVLLKRNILRGLYGQNLPTSSSSSPKELPPIKGTLVVCPLVAVMQWVSEIEKFTSKGSTKVLVYHGANRAKNHYQFAEYDFVITTYSIVEAEYRKYVMPPKDKCTYCGKLFYGDKLKFHLKYMCGPGAIRTAKQAKQQRKEQKSKKMSDFKGNAGHGDGKKHGNGEKEMETDYPLDYSAVAGELSSARKSILHSVMWERIVLDEAHYIKERRSNTTRAVFSLQSSYKWALSGTPLQNRVGELYSLVRFLQIVPYSSYFCKDCDCRTLDYSSAIARGIDELLGATDYGSPIAREIGELPGATDCGSAIAREIGELPGATDCGSAIAREIGGLPGATDFGWAIAREIGGLPGATDFGWAIAREIGGLSGATNCGWAIAREIGGLSGAINYG
ncbi:hypothetical protein OROGR_015255 [Orobanche gracilis]